jgi:hypothetical protein
LIKIKTILTRNRPRRSHVDPCGLLLFSSDIKQLDSPKALRINLSCYKITILLFTNSSSWVIIKTEISISQIGGITLKALNYAVLSPGALVEYKGTDEESYDILKKEIDGTLDIVQLYDLDIWVNDEGLLLELEPTLIIKNSPLPTITNDDIYLVGPIVFASSNEMGDTVSLTNEAKMIMNSFVPAKLGDHNILVYQNYKN